MRNEIYTLTFNVMRNEIYTLTFNVMRCDVMLYDLTRCDFKLCDSDAIPM